MIMRKVNLEEKFGLVDELWSPKIVGRVGDCHLKLGRIKGEFIWHRHDNEEEAFWVQKGRLCLQFRDGETWLEPGELLVIPKGVEHRPVAPEEVWIMMIEPVGTLNTGDVVNERTKQDPEWI